MGFGIAYLGYLSNKGYLNKPETRVLDIGSQCLLSAKPEDIREFLAKHGRKMDSALLSKEIERLSYFSYPRPGERTTYLSELFDLTEFEYTSYDVCPALKTEIFDLNRESVPHKYSEYYDIVLNFGTTEHVLNQFNSFRVMHDALAIGGIAIHQLPSTGFIDHGYFNYHITLFHDLIKTNDYEILEYWYTPAGSSNLTSENLDIRDAESPEVPRNANHSDQSIPNFLINVVLRKHSSHIFRLPLELATAHSSLSETIQELSENVPAEAAIGSISPVQTSKSNEINLNMVPGRVLANSLKKRIIHRIKCMIFSHNPARQQSTPQVAVPVNSASKSANMTLKTSQNSPLEIDADSSMDAHHHYELGKTAQDAGNFEKAFMYYRRALGLIHKYGPARTQMQTLSSIYLENSLNVLDKNNIKHAKSLLVRALELDPDNKEASSRLEKIIADEGQQDLTRQCFVFYDSKRAEKVHREAILRCLEYVSIAGVVGDVLEFGVLAGWSARIFCESIRKLMNPCDIHLFDSFDGLPEYTSDIDITSYEIAERNIWADKMRFPDDFQKSLGSSIDVHVRERLEEIISPERIHIYRGFYSDTLKQPLNVKASIIHIDCDLYQSTIEVLWALYNCGVYQDGCILMFDDWNCNKASPNYGERRAFQEFMDSQDQYISSLFFTYGFNGAAFFLHDRNA